MDTGAVFLFLVDYTSATFGETSGFRGTSESQLECKDNRARNVLQHLLRGNSSEHLVEYDPFIKSQPSSRN